MELRTTREMRRDGQVSRTMARKGEAPDAPAKAQRQAQTDKVSLSRQALAWAEEQNQRMWETAQGQERRRQGRMDGVLGALEGGRQELELLNKGLDVLDKCQKIAASIMKGDRVPPEDLVYLMNNDSTGYKLAMAMRREREDPEDCGSVLDGEDKDGGPVEGAGGRGDAPAPAASAPEAPQDGGGGKA